MGVALYGAYAASVNPGSSALKDAGVDGLGYNADLQICGCYNV